MCCLHASVGERLSVSVSVSVNVSMCGLVSVRACESWACGSLLALVHLFSVAFLFCWRAKHSRPRGGKNHGWSVSMRERTCTCRDLYMCVSL
jgi:hypothetical protein